ncbi:MAG: beta strand repeat-containing protein [Candidatus Porifericomitaceae bacterium WSBS_2022_MAG_OTU9]
MVDLLSGLDSDGSWMLAATSSYRSDSLTLTFSALENIQGGSGMDSFTVASRHGGNLMGGAGNDVFTVNAMLVGSLSAESGMDQITVAANGSVSVGVDAGVGDDAVIVTGGGSVAQSVVLGDGVDTLSIDDGRITGGVSSGSGDDTITVAAAGAIEGGISGGAGSDTFDINGGTVSGTVAGQGDSDTLDMADIASNLEIALTGAGGDGFAGNVRTGYSLDFSGIDSFTSGSGEDQLTGLDSAGLWTLAAAGFSYNSNGRSLMFSAVENLFGGSGSDTYNVEVAHSGDIRSGGGDDTININAALNGVVNTGTGGDVVNVNAALTGMVAAENGAIVSVNNSISGAVTLGAAGSTVIVGMAGSIGGGLVMTGGDNEVSISGGTVTGGIAVSPSAVSAADSLNLDITSGSITGNIIGGGGNDIFRVSGGTISGGSIMARSGLNDILDLSGNAAAADYRLSDVDGNGFTGSLTVKDNSGNTLFSAPFSGIGGIEAGSGMDTLFGLDRDSSWTVGNTGEYRVMAGALLLSAAIENIIAGSGIDVFTLTGGYSGNIQGGSGNDIFTIAGAHGGNIEGGVGDDSFAINAVVTGIIYGDSSTDASVAGTDSFVLAADSVATGGIEGGMGTDSFTAPDVSTAASTYMLSAMGVGSYSGGGQTQAFNGIENINAGVGDDIVMVADGAGLTGMFNGGGGENKLDFSSYTTAVTLTVLDVGGFADGPGFRVSVTPFADGADNINSFTGGSSSSDALRGIENDATVVSQFGANFVITEGSPTVIDGGVYSARDITNARRFSGRSIEYVAVEVVVGGAAEDVFEITDSGLIQGGGGIDRLDLRRSGSTGASIILSGVSEETGYSGRFVGVDLEFEGIDSVLGSAFSDSITGMGSGGTFEVYRESSGVYIGVTDSGALSSRQLQYTFVETIAGQDGNDIFFFEADGRQSGGIDGGGGRDTLDLSDFTIPVTAILGVTPDTARGRVYTGGVDGAALEVIVGRFETTSDVDGVSVVLPETYWTNIDKIVGASPIGDAAGEARGRSFLVVQSETAATDLIVNREKTEDDDSAAVAVTLPDLSEFEGYLFLGGSGTSMVADGDQGARRRIGGVPFPIGGVEAGEGGTVEPLPLSLPVVAGDMGDMSDSSNEALINARRLIIGGDVAHRGSVVLLGSTIIMEADLAAGVAVPNAEGGMTDSPPQYNLGSAAGSDYSVVAIATGMAETSASFTAAENGYIIPVLQDGERERSIYSGEAVIAAAATVQDSFNFQIDLGAGDLQFAQVLSSFVFFNPASNFIGRSLSPDIRTYLVGDLNLNIVEFILSVFNPASSLTQTSAFLIDTGLFEEDLSLFSAVGKGIALYLSMCEELEGCAPPIGLDVLDQLVAAAKDRLATIEVEYSKADVRDLPVLIEFVRNYRRVVRDMQNVRQEWMVMFAPELLPKDEPTAKDVSDQDLRLDAGRQPQAPPVEKAEIPAAITTPTKLIPEATGSGLNALENKGKTTPPKHRASSGAKPSLVPAPLRGLDGVLPDATPDDTKASKSYQKLFEQGRPEPFKKAVPQIRADISTVPVVSQR